uniref:PDZ domain-containing protein n=1 Tax=Fibrocapsa japonica TaxID=94617 RepID=A0A7S2V271_9STRA
MASSEVRALTLEVATRLAEVLVMQYPVLREAIRGVAARVLEKCLESVNNSVDELLNSEKDPFTVNDFLQQNVNKIRHNRFQAAVEQAFAIAASAENRHRAKEEIASFMKQWYRQTHGVNSSSNAEDMSAILEAYWSLAAKRFVDNACIVIDRKILGSISGAMQEQLYRFVQDDQKLASFFEVDATIIKRKEELAAKKERLMKASAAMSDLALRKSTGLEHMKVTVRAGAQGLGCSLGEESGKVTIQGFRAMPANTPNPAQEAGLKVGDIIDSINGERCMSLQEAVTKLQGSTGSISLSITRQ